MVLSEAEKGYLAGLIDGEGCIFISRYQIRTVKGTASPSYSLVLVIAQSDEPLLRYWQEKTGMGKIFTRERPAGSKWLPISQWRLTATDAKALLLLVAPYLVLKKDQANIALQFQALQGIPWRSGGEKGRLPLELIQEKERLKRLLSAGRTRSKGGRRPAPRKPRRLRKAAGKLQDSR